MVVILCLMTLISNVAANVLDDMQDKRAWPEVRGTLATKRSTPDSFDILDDSVDKKKATITEMENKVLERLQREIREAHSNYANQGDRRTDFMIEGDDKEKENRPFSANNRGQFSAETPDQFQTNRLIHWPCNLLYKRIPLDVDWEVTRGDLLSRAKRCQDDLNAMNKLKC